jgi:hypothetical protein
VALNFLRWLYGRFLEDTIPLGGIVSSRLCFSLVRVSRIASGN